MLSKDGAKVTSDPSYEPPPHGRYLPSHLYHLLSIPISSLSSTQHTHLISIIISAYPSHLYHLLSILISSLSSTQHTHLISIIYSAYPSNLYHLLSILISSLSSSHLYHTMDRWWCLSVQSRLLPRQRHVLRGSLQLSRGIHGDLLSGRPSSL